MSRYKLKGYFRWCLNWKNGWLSIGHMIIRWNTSYIFNDKEPFKIFTIEKVRTRD